MSLNQKSLEPNSLLSLQNESPSLQNILPLIKRPQSSVVLIKPHDLKLARGSSSRYIRAKGVNGPLDSGAILKSGFSFCLLRKVGGPSWVPFLPIYLSDDSLGPLQLAV